MGIVAITSEHLRSVYPELVILAMIEHFTTLWTVAETISNPNSNSKLQLITI